MSVQILLGCALLMTGAAPARPSTSALGGLYNAAVMSEGRQRTTAEEALADELLRTGFPVAASVYYTRVVRAGEGTERPLDAVEGLVRAQQQVQDEYLVPSLLAAEQKDSWSRLSPEVFARVSLLIAMVEHRKGLLDAARARLITVSPGSAVFAKAQYLLGVVLADARLPGGAQADAAQAAFSRVTALKDVHQEDLQNTRGLAQLGMARVHYAQGRYDAATAAYDAVPRFSRYWDEALFENGYARFRQGDLGGALGSLESLHAPQFEGSFLPESFILKGTIYFFSCLYEESKSSLDAFDQRYAPMMEQLKPWATEERDLMSYYRVVADKDSTAIARPVLLWIRSNERMLGLVRMLEETGKEQARLKTAEGVSGTGAESGLLADLAQTEGTLTQVAGQLARNRMVEAYRDLRDFSGRAEIIKFETTKADKELVESGVDQRALLAHQRVYRPRMPGSDWTYWKFQREYWIDEIGYYQYTLKNGCPYRDKK